MQEFLVLGAGSAGLLAALTLKRKMPQLSVRVLRSPEIAIIGVGESTTPNLPYHLFHYLELNTKRFYESARPTWKMGIHFIWGPRSSFEYTFDPQLDVRAAELPRPNGYYCDDDFTNVNLQSALMSQNKVFARQPNGGGPHIPAAHALHLENVRFVAALEAFARELGIEIIDGKMQTAKRGPNGIAALILEDGRRLEADFFIDASGFRSELLGKTLEEPFLSYSASLFNDRAILASWERGPDEPILPYTTAETMDAGWCWRIDHEDIINRGYVHCSTAISEDEARAELARKNPRATIFDRPVKFRSGRYQRGWVDNVLGVGNACGFVEPLESTAILVICSQCENFVEMLKNVGPTPSMRDLWNLEWSTMWDELRDFLTIHFCTNTRLDTPYWQRCRADADTSRLTSLLDFYHDNGPTGYARYLLTNPGSLFGVEGYLAMFVGNRVPYQNRHRPTDAEWRLFNSRRAQYCTEAQSGMSVEEALAFVKHPDWRWNLD